MARQFFIKDKNLKPENIKQGVKILNVTGTYEGGGGEPVLEDKTVDSSTVSQNVTASQGYDGLSSVTVEAYELDAKTVNSSTSQQVITSDKDGLSSVTVNPYTLDSKTVDPSTSQQTVNSNADGLSSVTVNAVTSSIDGNIQASNIKKDVTILGVTGTYEAGGGTPNLQDVSVTYQSNGTHTLTASSGYDGLGTVGVTVNVAGGSNDLMNALSGSDVSYPSVTSLDSTNIYKTAFSGCNLNSLKFNALTSVASNTFQDAFQSCDIASAEFNALTTISAGGVFQRAFKNTSLQSVSFANLTSVSGTSVFDNAFSGTNVTSLTFPSLVTADGTAAFAILYLDYLTSISFPELTTISNYAFDWGFCECTNLTYLNFPKLTSYNTYGTFDRAPFHGSNASNPVEATVHPAVLSSNSQHSNFLGACTGMVKVTFSTNATNNVYLSWAPDLDAASVLHVLTHLDLNISGKTVNFYSGGLTVTDDQQGSIQTAYDAAENAGWTINNLTIVAL